MQKIIISVFIVILVGSIISRCNTNKTQPIIKAQQEIVTTEDTINLEQGVDMEYGNTQKPLSTEKMLPCVDMLNAYEAFAVEFIHIVKKHKAKPTDVYLMKKYAEVMSQAGEWEEKTKDCAMDTSFSKQITRIQLQLDHIVSGM